MKPATPAGTGSGSWSCPRSQAGGALVMALLFLLMMTLLGVSALSTATLQERMAMTLQEQTRALHAAEYGIARTLKDHAEDLHPDRAPVEPLHFVLDVDEVPDATLEVQVSITHIGTVPAASAGGDELSHFRITAEAVSDTTGARVRVHQGAAVAIPTEANLHFVTGY